jgi:putative IMPACT (imprinted ancient) family translation regulator
MIETVRATVALDFSDMALIKARLLARDVAIINESFTDKGPVLAVELRKDEAEAILAMVLDLSRGKAVVSLDD